MIVPTIPINPTQNQMLTQRVDRFASADPTTGFLAATPLIYAIGAGITAAAGTVSQYLTVGS